MVWLVWIQRRKRSWVISSGGKRIRSYKYICSSRRTVLGVNRVELHGKPTALGAASGAVAGLVAITPASGFVGPLAAIFIGGAVSFICYFAIVMKGRLGYDDSLDVFGVHGVGGIWGAIATGLFATTAINPLGANGLFHGNPKLVLIQLLAVGAVFVYSFSMTAGLLKITGLFSDLRVSREEEHTGLDLTEHGEIGYSL